MRVLRNEFRWLGRLPRRRRAWSSRYGGYLILHPRLLRARSGRWRHHTRAATRDLRHAFWRWNGSRTAFLRRLRAFSAGSRFFIERHCLRKPVGRCV